MRTLVARWTLVLGLIGLAASPVFAAHYFSYECPYIPYRVTPAGQGVEFSSAISDLLATADSVDVIFEPHMPNSNWFAQWCHVSTGICYPGNQRIRLLPGQADSLHIDIESDWLAHPGIGFVSMTIQSVDDPYEVVHCTYTLFSGVNVPSNANYSVNCTDNTRWVSSGDLVTFKTPFRNNSSVRDTLWTFPKQSLPAGWSTQFCQVSTGICYYDNAQLPMTPLLSDTLEIEFFTGNIHGAGSMDFEFHSKRNPSLTQLCHFQVFHGNYLTSTPLSIPESPRLLARAVPNPSSAFTTIQLRSPQATTGSVDIFAADGRLVRSFTSLELAAGMTEIRWDGRSQNGAIAPGGVYFYRVQAGNGSARGMLIRSR